MPVLTTTYYKFPCLFPKRNPGSSQKNRRTGKGKPFPKKSRSILCKGSRLVVYRFIDQYKTILGLRWLLRMFQISPNAYYNYLKQRRYVRGAKNKIFTNLLKQDFRAESKNKIWCTDFTYIRLANGKMRYNCSILDVYDHSIVASVNGTYINTELAKKELEKALKSENPQEGLVLHSDQGCQFTSWEFVSYCKEKKVIQSMSKAGCPYDNTPMERFYNTLKNELIYPNHFYTEWELEEALSRYVFVWYNHIRPHSYNGGQTPFEARTKG